MGLRSDFERVERDYYRTFDPLAVKSLKPFIKARTTFIEPCAGDGILTDQLVNDMGLVCLGEYDIEPQNKRIIQLDALTLEEKHVNDVDLIISNTPWDRKLLHPMIERFSFLKPSWLLFDSNWAFTKQASHYMKELCTDMVAIGRLKWIEDTTMSGKDNCSWYRFDVDKQGGCLFHGR